MYVCMYVLVYGSHTAFVGYGLQKKWQILLILQSIFIITRKHCQKQFLQNLQS